MSVTKAGGSSLTKQWLDLQREYARACSMGGLMLPIMKLSHVASTGGDVPLCLLHAQACTWWQQDQQAAACPSSLVLTSSTLLVPGSHCSQPWCLAMMNCAVGGSSSSSSSSSRSAQTHMPTRTGCITLTPLPAVHQHTALYARHRA
jgi:hypothetical protein